jgi:hypothetical protein
MSDLELGVSDRLADHTIERRERNALVALQAQLTMWRRDHTLQFHTRAIVIVERLVKRPFGRVGSASVGGKTDVSEGLGADRHARWPSCRRQPHVILEV